ncbi:MAG: dihydroxy-acid dehydratase [Streptococcus sp.]
MAKEGVKDAGAWPVQFGMITVADEFAMGTPGMRFSLTSRDIIADSIKSYGWSQRRCLCCYWWL